MVCVCGAGEEETFSRYCTDLPSIHKFSVDVRFIVIYHILAEHKFYVIL